MAAIGVSQGLSVAAWEESTEPARTSHTPMKRRKSPGIALAFFGHLFDWHDQFSRLQQTEREAPATPE